MHATSRRIAHILRRIAPLQGSLGCRRFASGATPSERLRNIGISAHIDSGKTTVTERILFYSGRIEDIHEVRGKDGVGATMDWMELERERGITIQSAATHITWKGRELNIIDTPGHVDFTVEVERALRVLDGAVLVLCGVAGVQSQTLTVNRQLSRYDVPFITFINKLDRGGADAYKVLEGFRKRLGHNAALLQLPIGREADFAGVVDLLEEKAVYFRGDKGTELVEEAIPADMRAQASDYRQQLIEHVADGDEAVGELFLEEKLPTVEQLKAGIRRAVVARKFMPVMVGTALKNKGVQPLLDAVADFLPHPEEVANRATVEQKGLEPQTVVLNPSRAEPDPTFVGLAFKLEAGPFGQLTYFRVYQGRIQKGDTIWNTRMGTKVRVQRLIRMHANNMEDISAAYAGDICATFGIDCASGDTFTTDANLRIGMESMHVPEPVISMSIAPKHSKQADNFTKALTRFTKEDPTFRRSYDAEMGETVVSGMGELQLDVYASRMKSEFNCEVVLGKPKVAYRETLTEDCPFDHTHRKQTGGQGQYGRAIGTLELLPPEKNTEVEFKDSCSGPNVPKSLVPALKKGYLEMVEKGPIIGYKVAGVRFHITDGAHHSVDSTEIAFINLAKGVMKDCYERASWVLTQPIMKVEVTGPMEFQDFLCRSIMARNGTISGTDMKEDYFTVEAEAPLSDMFGFASELRSGTQGKGEFTMEYARYLPLTPDLQNRVVQQIQQQQEAADAKAPAKKKRK